MTGAFRVLNRHWQVFARTWLHNLMFNVAEPLLYLSAMGFGLGVMVGRIEGVTYLEFIAPGMVALSAMYSATFECTYGTFLRLHYQKTLQAILAGPVTVGEVIAGAATGRSDDEQVTVFDTSGIAVQDLSASKIAYDRAVEAGLGTVVEL